jgi:hypothetical protein
MNGFYPIHTVIVSITYILTEFRKAQNMIIWERNFTRGSNEWFVRYFDSRDLLQVIDVEVMKEATKCLVTHRHISVLGLLWM